MTAPAPIMPLLSPAPAVPRRFPGGGQQVAPALVQQVVMETMPLLPTMPLLSPAHGAQYHHHLLTAPAVAPAELAETMPLPSCPVPRPRRRATVQPVQPPLTEPPRYSHLKN